MKKIDWVPISLGILAFCAIIQLVINSLGIFTAVSRMDNGVEFQRGALKARSEAHRFIRHRVSPDMARSYYEWLERR